MSYLISSPTNNHMCIEDQGTNNLNGPIYLLAILSLVSLANLGIFSSSHLFISYAKRKYYNLGLKSTEHLFLKLETTKGSFEKRFVHICNCE